MLLCGSQCLQMRARETEASGSLLRGEAAATSGNRDCTGCCLKLNKGLNKLEWSHFPDDGDFSSVSIAWEKHAARYVVCALWLKIQLDTLVTVLCSHHHHLLKMTHQLPFPFPSP